MDPDRGGDPWRPGDDVRGDARVTVSGGSTRSAGIAAPPVGRTATASTRVGGRWTPAAARPPAAPRPGIPAGEPVTP
jgi:hypothetical protein